MTDSEKKPIRAFEVEAMGVKCIVAAYSVGEARYWAQKAANEVGYPVKYTEVKVRREPQFDPWACPQVARRCWSREVVEKCL